MKSFSVQCLEPQAGPPDLLEVKVNGFLDAHTAVQFEETMDQMLKLNYNKVIINLEELNYISSAGIGTLMVLLHQLRQRQGDMVILKPSPKVLKLLEMLGFTKIFTIVQQYESARAALG